MRSGVGKKLSLSHLALALIILGGSWLHTYHLDTFSFWIDESLTPIRATNSLRDLLTNVIQVQELATQDTHPPFYFIILSITQRMLGQSDFAYRLPSALFAIITIPLMYQTAKRMFSGSETAGLVAALLFAISPLSIWYAQEARMYTLLNLEGILLLYILYRAWDDIEQAGPAAKQQTIMRWLVPYGLVALSTVLTHVVGAFFVLGQSLIWGYLIWRHVAYGKWIVIGSVLAGLVAIPFAPQLLPRLFSGAEKGFYQVPIPDILRDLVRGYGLGFTPTDIYQLMQALWVGFLVLLLLGSAILIRQSRWRLLVLLLISLLSPALFMGGVSATLKPIYTGIRHIMIGHTPFVLLVTLAIVQGGWLLTGRNGDRQKSRSTLVLIGVLLSLVPLVGAFTSIMTLFNNPAVAKDNVRDLVTYIESRAGTNDVVVYNDPILMLTHKHYATRSDDELHVTALPVYPHAVSDRTAGILSEFRGVHDRIWYVPSPPNDGRDDGFFVAEWLEENAILIDEASYTSKATLLKSEAYQTKAAQEAPVKQLPEPLIFSDGGELALALTNAQVSSLGPERIWFDTSWVGATPVSDLSAAISLIGPLGWQWMAFEQPLFTVDDDFEWNPETQNLIQLDIPRPQGLTPGEYQWQISLNRAGDVGESQQFGDVLLVEAFEIPPSFLSESGQHPTEIVEFDNGVSLSGFELNDTSIRPGHFLSTQFMLSSETEIDSSDLSLRIQIFSPQNELVFDEIKQPAEQTGPSWLADTLYRGHAEFLFPADAAPGVYEIRWQLLDGEEVIPGRRGFWPFSSAWPSLGEIEVKAWPLLTQPPEVQTRVDATFDPVAELYGANIIRSGDSLTVEKVWYVETAPAQMYLSYVHVVDAATGDIVTQQDWIPNQGLRPTTGWRAGEYLVDTHVLDLAGLPPGRYLINTGLFEPGSFVRPTVTQNGVNVPEQQVTIGELELK